MEWSSFDELEHLDGLTIVVVGGESHDCPLCRIAGVAPERTDAVRAPRPHRGAAFGLREAPHGQPEG